MATSRLTARGPACFAVSGAIPSATRTPTGPSTKAGTSQVTGAESMPTVLWLLGRVDDVMNVSGHRISTAEVESALVDHEAVAEAAVVGATDDVTGQAIVGYVILVGSAEASDELREEIRQHVAKKLGSHRPSEGRVPRARLAEDPFRQDHAPLLRDVADGRDLGDTTTLADPGVVSAIAEGAADNDED